MQPKTLKTEQGRRRDWGLAQWAPHLLDLLLDSSNRSVNMHMTCQLRRIIVLSSKDVY